jgi:hypothetical protein
MRPRDRYDRLIASMPASAERVVLRVLSYHIGLERAIQKPNLITECAKGGCVYSNERQLRLTIVALRKAGVPVCASSGESGYYLAGSLAEYQEFRGREYVKKILDMRETVAAMDAAVREMFASEYQDYKRCQAERTGQPALL